GEVDPAVAVVVDAVAAPAVLDLTPVGRARAARIHEVDEPVAVVVEPVVARRRPELGRVVGRVALGVRRPVDVPVAVVVDAVPAGGRLRDEARGAQLGLVLARRLRGRSDLEPAVELAEGPARPAPAADVEAVRARGPGRALDAVE